MLHFFESRKLSRLRIEFRQRRTTGPYVPAGIDSDGMFLSGLRNSLLSWFIRILIFGNGLRVGIPAPQLVRALLRQPYRAVRRRNRGMNRGRAHVRNRKILHLAGLGIQARNFVRHAEVWNPDISILD